MFNTLTKKVMIKDMLLVLPNKIRLSKIDQFCPPSVGHYLELINVEHH